MTEPAPTPERIVLLYIGVRGSMPLQHFWYDLTGIDNDGQPLKEEDERRQFYGSKKKG